MRSGFAERSLRPMLVKSRVGVGCAIMSSTSKPRLGSSPASVFAIPEPNAPSSYTRMTVFAGLPAASLILTRLSSETSVIFLNPGEKRNTP